MSKNPSRSNKIAVVGITLVLLLIPFGVYYYLYVSDQNAFLTKRSHRVLSDVGSQIVSRVDGVQQVVRYSVSAQCESESGVRYSELELAKSLGDYLAARSPFGIKLQFDRSSGESEDDVTNVESLTRPLLSVEFKQVGSAQRLMLNYFYSALDASDDQCGPGKVLLRPGNFSVSADMAELLRPVIERFVRHERRNSGEDLFDKILVAESDTGAIVFEQGMDEVRIVNLDELLGKSASKTSHMSSQDKAAEDGGADRSEGKNGDTKKQSDGTPNSQQQNPSSKSEEASVDARGRGHRVSALGETEVASGEFKLFVQPIQLTIPRSGSKTDQGHNLIVCGLMRSSTFSDRTYSFPYTVLLGFIVVVVMTALSIPLIKLTLLGPKDNVRKADVLRTAGSAFLGIALLTLTLLDGHAYFTLEAQLDDQLELLAANVDHNFRSELASIAEQLDRLNRHEKLAEDFGKDPQSKEFLSRESILAMDEVVNIGQDPYPYFNSALWIAKQSGEQKIKYSTTSAPTAPINVSARRFFQDAKERKLWRISTPENGTPSLCLEPINSRTSGENVTVVSKLMPESDFVSAMDSKLISLYDPVLPSGYGFCVIDSNGRVLFHSDALKNLQENLFDECDNLKSLRAAVLTRQREFVDVKYVGRSNRVLVTPMQDLPWTLAVLRDADILGTVNLEIVTLTVVALSFWALVLVVIVSLAFVLRSNPWLQDIWPYREKLESYKRVLLVNCVLFALFLVLVTLTRGGWRLIACGMIFPGLVIAQLLRPINWTRVQSKPAKEPSGQEQTNPPTEIPNGVQAKPNGWLADYRRAYALALLSVLVLVSVAPTIAFFKLFRDEQIRVFLLKGQISLARGLEKREGAVRRHFSRLLGMQQADDEAANKKIALENANTAVEAAKGTDPKTIDPTTIEELANEQAAAMRAYAEAVGMSDFVRKRTEWFIRKRLQLKWDVYESFFFGTSWTPIASQGAKTADKDPLLPDRGPLTWFLTTFSPLYDETCVDIALLPRGKSYDDHWESKSDEPRRLVLQSTTKTTTGEDRDEHKTQAWDLASIAPTVTSIGRLSWWFVLFLGASLLVLSYFVMRFAARRLLLLDLETPRSCSVFQVPKPDDGNRLIIGLPFDNNNAPGDDAYPPVDLRKISAEQWSTKLAKLEDLQNATVLIDHFEFNREDPAWNQRKLDLVENLLDNGNHVHIRSAVDPMRFPLPRSQKKSGESDSYDAEPNPQEDAERWAVLLTSFVRKIGSDQTNGRPDPKLHAAPSVTTDTSDNGTEGGEFSDDAEACDQAETYYRAVWATCLRGERLTLCQVAQYGLVSRFDPDLRGLMQKGLVTRKESLLIDKPFARFVIRTASEEGVLADRAHLESSWEKWRLPLLLVLFAVIAFIFATQRELFDSTLTLATAMTGGVVAFLRFVGMFGKEKAGTTQP